MKVGLISDIHGNAPALRAALGELDARGISDVICGGDLVGYYPFVNEVISLVRERDIPCVMGNHDAMLCSQLSSSRAARRRRGLDHARSVLTSDNFRWLSELPRTTRYQFESASVQAWHGSPWSPLEEYVYPDHDEFARFREIDCDVVVLGHTHWPFVKVVGDVHVVNPGSVGQPRDYQPGAAFAVLETEGLAIELCRAEYDIGPVVDEATQAGADSDVIEILSRSRSHRAN